MEWNKKKFKIRFACINGYRHNRVVLIFYSTTGITSYFLLGGLDIPLILLLGSGAVLGAFLGPKVLKKNGSKYLRKNLWTFNCKYKPYFWSNVNIKLRT